MSQNPVFSPQRPVKALLFDLDGTLVDTELQTDQAILEVMARHGYPNLSLPATDTRGRSWRDTVSAILARTGSRISAATLEEELLSTWQRLIEQPNPLPGVVAALRRASGHFKLAVVSSSPTLVINHSLAALGVDELIPAAARIGADQLQRHKPFPDGFLLGAERLGTAIDACVVFEDSSAGLRAARSAGASSVAVLRCSAEKEACRGLADAAIDTYSSLDESSWQVLRDRGPSAWGFTA